LSEINAIVSDWINDTFGGSQSEWIDSGGDSEDFDDFLSNLVDDVAEDVEGDLDVMVQDHLQNFRYYDIATTIEAEIAEIEPEEMDNDPR
jgi:hypothetical protein